MIIEFRTSSGAYCEWYRMRSIIFSGVIAASFPTAAQIPCHSGSHAVGEPLPRQQEKKENGPCHRTNRSSHMARKLPPIHPGEILREEFLVPLKLTPYAIAAALDVPRTRIERIAREEKPVTADTALRLGKFFKTGAAFWMNIQARFDLETAEDVLAPQIRKIAPYEAA
jgi:addiction module HigA family antidote